MPCKMPCSELEFYSECSQGELCFYNGICQKISKCYSFVVGVFLDGSDFGLLNNLMLLKCILSCFQWYTIDYMANSLWTPDYCKHMCF